MGREVVTGYCWPQSVDAGEQVGLHLSSSAGRPVRVEVARVGARREVVFSSIDLDGWTMVVEMLPDGTHRFIKLPERKGPRSAWTTASRTA